MPSGSPISAGQSHTRSAGLVFLASWAMSVPWAIIHGPVDPKWVVAQALGAGILPSVAGWLTLWRTRGNLEDALMGSGVAAVVVLIAGIVGSAR